MGGLPNITQQYRDQISQQVQEALPRVKSRFLFLKELLPSLLLRNRKKGQKRTKLARGRGDLRGKKEERWGPP